MKKKWTLGKVLVYVALITYTIFLFFPIMTVLITSFVPSSELATSKDFIWWSDNPTIEAYISIFSNDSYINVVGIPGLLLGFFNTMWLTLIPLVIGLSWQVWQHFLFQKWIFHLKKLCLNFL